MKNFIYLIAITLFLASCSTSMHTGGDVLYPTKPLINIEALNGKLVVDKSKVLTGVSTSKVIFMIFRTGDNTFLETKLMAPAKKKKKKAAMFKALENTGYDIIVNPKYIIKQTSELFGMIKTETVQVSGYGAKIEL